MSFNVEKILSQIPVLGLGYTIIVTFTLSFMLSMLGMKYILSKPEKVSIIAAELITPTQTLFSENEFNQVIERNIFNITGEVPKEDMAKKEKVIAKDEIKKTDLPLKLLGIIYSGDPSSGMAVIEQAKERIVESFFVGDFLIGDATLFEVHEKKIIIDRGEYKEFLTVEEPELRTDSRNITKAKVQDSSKYALDEPPNEYREDGFERIGNEVTLSKEYRQKLLSTEFAKILQDVKAVPHFENNELKGYRMTKLKEGSIYQKMGLQANDIIKEINGFVLDDASQVLKYLQSLRAEQDFEIEVLRSGKTQVIHLQVQ